MENEAKQASPAAQAAAKAATAQAAIPAAANREDAAWAALSLPLASLPEGRREIGAESADLPPSWRRRLGHASAGQDSAA